MGSKKSEFEEVLNEIMRIYYEQDGQLSDEDRQVLLEIHKKAQFALDWISDRSPTSEYTM